MVVGRVAQSAQHGLGDLEVVVAEGELRVAAGREEDLLGVGEANLVSVELEGDVLVLGHAGRIR